MKFTIIIKSTAQKQLKKMPLKDIHKIEKVILQLETEPRPIGCKKLVGSINIYRIRIGNYRVVYKIIDQQLILYIFDIDHRKDIYR